MSSGPQPEWGDGDTREEERCHRRVHDIQGGGEDAEIVWAGARNFATVTPGRRRGVTVKSGTSREEERMPEPVWRGARRPCSPNVVQLS